MNYYGTLHFLDSDDIEYFFEFHDEVDGFDGELYRIESYFGDFNLEASRLPGRMMGQSDRELHDMLQQRTMRGADEKFGHALNTPSVNDR